MPFNRTKPKSKKEFKKLENGKMVKKEKPQPKDKFVNRPLQVKKVAA
jgi:hypothetical protein